MARGEDGGQTVYVQEASNGKLFSLKLDAREVLWVQRVIAKAIGKQQWVRRNFRGDSGMLIFQTLENHAGKMMRIWRTGERGWDTILVPGNANRGWATFLNGLVVEAEETQRFPTNVRPLPLEPGTSWTPN
ncbi:hypothetical protein Scep_002781 [Stephania cephalantha]|uniref:Uncharacterized protein n=1 Tax=Stephania cephalantha TaxID=152367 RepID=A0AAP0Q4X5_9MAGN